MSDKKISTFFRNAFKVGTPECAIAFAVIAMILAILFLLVGFWKTVLILALMLIGAFVGGVSNKKERILALFNRAFPQKNTVAFREKNPEIEQAVRATLKESDKEQRTQEDA